MANSSSPLTPSALVSALNSLCSTAPEMPSCDLATHAPCKPYLASLASSMESTLSTTITPSFCSPWTLISTICSKDNPDLSGCSLYTSTCTNNAAAAANTLCTVYPPLPSFPSTASISKQVQSICKAMPMSACSTANCKQVVSAANATGTGCDVLSVYSGLCRSMPKMGGCASFTSLCSASSLSDSEACGGPNNGVAKEGSGDSSSSTTTTSPTTTPSGSGTDDSTTAVVYADIPPMLMYFHTGTFETVLVETWITRTKGQYALAWILTFLLGIMYEGWISFSIFVTSYLLTLGLKNKTANKGAASKFLTAASKSEVTVTDGATFLESKSEAKTAVAAKTSPATDRSTALLSAIVRGLLRTIQAGIAYLLMLIAMTYNVGLFFAVIIGLGFGSAIFGGRSGYGYTSSAAVIGAGSSTIGEVSEDVALCC